MKSKKKPEKEEVKKPIEIKTKVEPKEDKDPWHRSGTYKRLK